jgi:hypothetical protein
MVCKFVLMLEVALKIGKTVFEVPMYITNNVETYVLEV